MTMQTHAPAGSPTFRTTVLEYFVPPLVIPVAVVLAVVLFALLHGPVV
ncbi:hypothetical protein [Azospirillum sp.]|nr:hypothetical protein [Azospirillum sp.]HYD68837.1 hypothetical protein [Azospirillum sp.]